jgi:hypothetical protein
VNGAETFVTHCHQAIAVTRTDCISITGLGEHGGSNGIGGERSNTADLLQALAAFIPLQGLA